MFSLKKQQLEEKKSTAFISPRKKKERFLSCLKTYKCCYKLHLLFAVIFLEYFFEIGGYVKIIFLLVVTYM